MIHPRRSFPRNFFSGLTLAALGACSVGPSVHDLPPPNYSIAGVWELNAALSTDADKVLASLQPKPPGSSKGRGGPGPGAVPGTSPGQNGSQPAPEVINDPTTDLPPIDISAGGRNQGMFGGGYYADRERNMYRPPIDFQVNALLGGEWLKISQTDSEVRISNAATNRSYTPGERSVVSVTSGVADQVSGWKGRTYVIFLKPQIGPEVNEAYSLTSDGRQLLVTIKVSSEGKNKAISVTRTYDRSSKDPATLHQTLQVTLPPTD